MLHSFSFMCIMLVLSNKCEGEMEKFTPQKKATITLLTLTFIFLFYTSVDVLSERGVISPELSDILKQTEVWLFMSFFSVVIIILVWFLLVTMFSEPER